MYRRHCGAKRSLLGLHYSIPIELRNAIEHFTEMLYPAVSWPRIDFVCIVVQNVAYFDYSIPTELRSPTEHFAQLSLGPWQIEPHAFSVNILYRYELYYRSHSFFSPISWVRKSNQKREEDTSAVATHYLFLQPDSQFLVNNSCFETDFSKIKI